jgi:DNA-binding CsgD family transcriptional regulator
MHGQTTEYRIVSFTHKLLLSIYFFFVLGFVAWELFEALEEMGRNGVSWEILGEFALLLMTTAGLAYLLSLNVRHKREKAQLAQQLGVVREQLATSNARFREGKKEFSRLIQWQFGEWGLTPSEQEIAYLLLKGLSFREVAAARTTKEKTVRQQATAIYTKAGLHGRNELAAWFFEDLL